jgi:very-short-patch-repair endonuclease
MSESSNLSFLCSELYTNTKYIPPLWKRGAGGILIMEKYNKQLKQTARTLRANMTDAEQKLWYHLRRKQIQGLQFYRQKPLLNFIVDFYCPAAKLVVEIDGSQHAETSHQLEDQRRSELLASLGLAVLRFDNRQVLLEMDAVLAVINSAVAERKLNPP